MKAQKNSTPAELGIKALKQETRAKKVLPSRTWKKVGNLLISVGLGIGFYYKQKPIC